MLIRPPDPDPLTLLQARPAPPRADRVPDPDITDELMAIEPPDPPPPGPLQFALPGAPSTAIVPPKLTLEDAVAFATIEIAPPPGPPGANQAAPPDPRADGHANDVQGTMAEPPELPTEPYPPWDPPDPGLPTAQAPELDAKPPPVPLITVPTPIDTDVTAVIPNEPLKDNRDSPDITSTPTLTVMPGAGAVSTTTARSTTVNGPAIWIEDAPATESWPLLLTWKLLKLKLPALSPDV